MVPEFGNGFAISFMGSLYLVKKEMIALVMDQMELLAVFNMMEIFLTTCAII